MKRKILVIAAALLLTAVSWGWWQMRPHVYRTATSPDSSWSVTVLRKRSAPPPMEGVDVIVRVRDAKGNILLDRVIDIRDLWTDVDDRYPDVTCGNDEIMIGPEWWTGKEMAYWRLKKTDLEPANAAYRR
jgi:hypothetical protein